MVVESSFWCQYNKGMNRIFLIANRDDANTYFEKYVTDHQFLPYQITTYEEALSVEKVREIVGSLAYKVNSKKLLFFNCEFSIAAQNAFLKCVEESNELVHFLFASPSQNDLLPTLRSRCIVKRIYNENKDLGQMKQLIVDAVGKKSSWEETAQISELLTDGTLNDFIVCLRNLMLEEQDHSLKMRYYALCKKSLLYSSLVENNNVNKSLVVEAVLLYKNVRIAY